MEIIGIQIIGVLFGLLVFYLTFLHFKRKEFTSKEFLLWALLGLFFILFSVFPELVYPLSDLVKLKRPLDLFILLGFMFLIGAVFYTYSNMRQVQKKLEELVRKLAIEKKDDKRKK